MATQATGTRDTSYDLVSILQHALQGGETYQRYIQDAEQAGDQDSAQYFRDVQEEEKRRAERAEQLLAQRLELRVAACLAGVEQQTLDMALQRFVRRVAEAANGTGEAKDALAQMGIALRDQSGNLCRSQDLLGDVADAFARIEDPVERVRLAFKLCARDRSGEAQPLSGVQFRDAMVTLKVLPW